MVFLMKYPLEESVVASNYSWGGSVYKCLWERCGPLFIQLNVMLPMVCFYY